MCLEFLSRDFLGLNFKSRKTRKKQFTNKTGKATYPKAVKDKSDQVNQNNRFT